MSTTREEVLGRVRRALGGTRRSPEEIHAAHAAIQRDYQAEPTLTPEERLELFTDRLVDYDATVHPCAEAEVPATIAGILRERGKTGLLTSPAFPAAWLPDGFTFDRSPELPYEALDACEGAVTDCVLAIAVTGTIVLRHSPELGRRALSLVPDYLLCVIRAEQVVETVPEAIRRMAGLLPESLTTISGPSATADIEMTRIKGVHGPRTLEVILVG